MSSLSFLTARGLVRDRDGDHGGSEVRWISRHPRATYQVRVHLRQVLHHVAELVQALTVAAAWEVVWWGI